jgi:hypothetical protein
MDPDILKCAAALDKSDNLRVSTIARVYSCPKGNSDWEYNGLFGALFLVESGKEEIPYLKLVNIDNLQITFEDELYVNLRLQKLTDFFYTYESDNAVIGICFAEGQNPNQFAETVKASCTTSTSSSATKKVAPKKEKSSEGGFLSGLKNITSMFSFGRKKAAQPEISITRPTKMTHNWHIGVDGTMNWENLPDEWKTIFSEAGVGREALQDKRTVKVIMKTLAQASDATESEPMPSRNENEGIYDPSGMTAPPPPPPPPPPMGGVKKSNWREKQQDGTQDIPQEAPKPKPRVPMKPPTPGRDQLLAQIRNVNKSTLKTVGSRPVKEVKVPDLNKVDKKNLADMIRVSLANMRQHMEDDEEESDFSDDD